MTSRSPMVLVNGISQQLQSGDTLVGAMVASNIQIAATLVSASGVVTIDLSQPCEFYVLTLTENVTSWVFNNPPASGYVAQIYIEITQGASTTYTCVSPASTNSTAGGLWVISSALGAVESLGIRVKNGGNRTLFASGVYA